MVYGSNGIFGTYFHLATQNRVVVCDVRLKCVFRQIFSLEIIMFWFSIFILNNCIHSKVSTRLGNRLMDLFGLSPPHLIESLRSWMGRLKFFSIFLGQQIFPFRDTKYFPETTNTSFARQKIFSCFSQQIFWCPARNVLFIHKYFLLSYFFNFLEPSKFSEQEGSGKGVWN